MANYIAVSFSNTFGRDPYQVSEPFDAYCRFQITKALEMLEEQLGENDFLLERSFSAADISLGYTLFFTKVCTGVKFTNRVGAYFGRLMARPAAQKAIADVNGRGGLPWIKSQEALILPMPALHPIAVIGTV